MARAQHHGQEREGGIPDGLILGIMGFLLGMTILVWTGTGIAGLVSHGAWPAEVHFTRTPVAMRHLIAEPHDIAGAWRPAPPEGLPGSGLFWGVFIGQLMVLFVLTVFVMGVIARTRLRHAARRTAALKAAEAAVEPETPVRPRQAPQRPLEAPTAVDPEPQSVPVGPAAAPTAGPAGPSVTTDHELTRTYAAFAALRSDKGKRLVQPAVLNAAGPVLVTTADPDTFHQTVGNRAKLGPVHVYDPAHLVDTPARLRWAPHSGCADVPTAVTRARALLFPVRPRAAADAAMFDAAETLLRCWLHAAAVDGQPFRQVHRWAGGSSARTPSASCARIPRRPRAGAVSSSPSSTPTPTAATPPRPSSTAPWSPSTPSTSGTPAIRDAPTASNWSHSSRIWARSMWWASRTRTREPTRVRCRCSPHSSPAWSSTAGAWPQGHPPVGSTHQ